MTLAAIGLLARGLEFAGERIEAFGLRLVETGIDVRSFGAEIRDNVEEWRRWDRDADELRRDAEDVLYTDDEAREAMGLPPLEGAA